MRVKGSVLHKRSDFFRFGRNNISLLFEKQSMDLLHCKKVARYTGRLLSIFSDQSFDNADDLGFRAVNGIIGIIFRQ